MDVDHINGNRYDNRDENLQTLCANCHRLKTRLSGDYLHANTLSVSQQESQYRLWDENTEQAWD
jgi:hypothetical protein